MEHNNPKIIEIKTIDFSTFNLNTTENHIDSNIDSNESSASITTDLNNKIIQVEQDTLANLEKIKELEKKLKDSDLIRVTIDESLTKIIRTNIPINWYKVGC